MHDIYVVNKFTRGKKKKLLASEAACTFVLLRFIAEAYLHVSVYPTSMYNILLRCSLIFLQILVVCPNVVPFN